VYLFGYRVDQVRLPKLSAVKDKTRITRFRPEQQSYPCLSVRLPIYLDKCTPPRPDPGHMLSVLSGVAKRAAVKTPTPNPKVLRSFSRFVDLWLRRNLEPLLPDECLNFTEWLEGTSYTADKKRDLTKLWHQDVNPPVRKLRKVKCFVKDETYAEYKYPRGIYSRSDHAKILFGPLVASINEKLFSLPWFIKKIPVSDRPMAIYETLYRPGAVYNFTDYTSFESHFVKTIQKICENKLYIHMTKKTPAMRKIAVEFHKVKSSKQSLTFKTFDAILEAFRCSGEMDTSTSNGFSNLMLWLFNSWRVGCPEKNVHGFVEGDDGIFRNDGPSPTAKHFEECGFTIKLGETKHLTEASFCGQVYDIEDQAVVTDIREQLARLGWTNKKYVRAGKQVRLELLRAKGFSLLFQYTNCPVLGQLGMRILELTSHVTVRQSIVDQMDWWEKEKWRLYQLQTLPTPRVGENTRNLVERLYGVTVSEQLHWECQIKSMSLGPMPFVLSNPPPSWEDYFEKFSSPWRDTPPSWLSSKFSYAFTNLQESGLLNNSTINSPAMFRGVT